MDMLGLKGFELCRYKMPRQCNQPMLPLAPGNDSDSIDIIMMCFNKGDMCLGGSKILPAVKIPRIQQQYDTAVFVDSGVENRGNRTPIPDRYFTADSRCQQITAAVSL